MHPGKCPLLQALRLNALFSGTSALLMFAGAGWIAKQLGLGNTLPVYATAPVLLVFALQLGNVVRTATIRPREILGIIAADLAWVIGSVVLAMIFLDRLTTAGVFLVGAVALAVLVFAIRQYQGLRVFQHTAGS